MSIKRILISSLVAIVEYSAFYVACRVIRENRQWELSRAAADGDLATVRGYVEAGASVDAVPTRHFGDQKGLRALAEAAFSGREDVVRYLLDHGANPNLGSKANPLIIACWRKHYSVAKLLLEHGADPNARGEGTPLVAAEGTEQSELVALLRQHGAHDDLNWSR